MLTVYVSQPTTRPFDDRVVTLTGVDKLTPKSARAALRIAFNNEFGGVVVDKQAGVGYRVYGSSARKFRY